MDCHKTVTLAIKCAPCLACLVGELLKEKESWQCCIDCVSHPHDGLEHACSENSCETGVF